MLVFGVIGAFCTAVYMARAWWLTFFGEYRGHGTPHESPKLITVPLVVLTIGAVTFGFLNFPSTDVFPLSLWPDGWTLRFEHYVEPTFAFPGVEHPTFSWPIAVGTTVLGALGIFLAYQYWALGKSPFKGLSQRQPFAFAYRALQNKYWLDVLYTDKIVGAVKGPIARAAGWANQHVIDVVVNAVGVGSRIVGGFTYKYLDQGAVDRVVNESATASDRSGQLLRRVQTGKVQQYAAMLFGGAILFALVLVIFV
jgi:NADH-quinone oxidoreductase subunit L